MSRKSREKIVAVKKEQDAAPISPSQWSWLPAGICIGLAALVWGVFGQTLHHGFVNFDDDQYVYENLVVAKGLSQGAIAWAFTHVVSGNWHPLTMLSHMLDCQLYGLNPEGHHLTNVLLHGATVILLFLAFRFMTGAVWRSAFVAAVFAIHPLRVESVAWVAERKDVLSGLFFVLTLWAYAHFVRQKKSGEPGGFYWLALALFALGLMAKPMLVTVPFVLLLLDVWPLNRIAQGMTWPRLILEKIPFLLLALAACAATVYAQQHMNAVLSVQEVDFTTRIGNAFESYAAYIRQMIYPVRLAVFYPLNAGHPPVGKVGGCVLLIGIVTAAVLVVRRKAPFLLTGWLWYLGMLVPVIGLIQVGSQAHADRYTYLTQIGLYIALAWGAVALWEKQVWSKPFLGTAAVAIIACLSTLAHSQSAYWQNSYTLWTHALACGQESPMAHNNLGTELSKEGKTGEAIEQFKMALKLRPDHLESQNNLGAALAGQGNYAEAIQHYEKALQIDPKYPLTHNNLGTLLNKEGKWDEAISHYQRALELKPAFPEAMVNLANTLAHQQKWDEAIHYYKAAIELSPTNADAHNGLGNAFTGLGKWTDAAHEYDLVFKFKPDNADVHYNLGITLLCQEKWAEAGQQFARAIELKPDHAEAQKNLGSALAHQGNWAEAAKHYRRALDLQPGNADFRISLAEALDKLGRWPECSQEYSRALEQEPTNAVAHFNLAVALAKQGKLAEAVGHYQRAVQFKPDYTDAHNNLGNALIKQGKLDEAVEQFQQALALAPADANAHNNLGSALSRQEKRMEAITEFNKAIELRPDYIEAHFNLGLELARQGKSDEALQHFQRALDLASGQNKVSLVETIRKQVKSYQLALARRQNP